MTQHLTLAEVQAAAAKAYAEGRLTAQHPIHSLRKCVYEGDSGCGCAIGVALTSETLEAIKRHAYQFSRVIALINGEVISVDPKEEEALRNIQRTHDTWCSMASYEMPSDGQVERARLAFLQAIGVEEVVA